MAKCKKLQRKKTQVCIGSLNRKIELYIRAITSPLNSLGASVDYNESFTLIDTVWAMIETPKGQTIFDEIGTEKIISDVFYTRYLPNITSETWIVYNNNRYDIIRVTDLESNSLFLKLDCVIRGSADKDASKA